LNKCILPLGTAPASRPCVSITGAHASLDDASHRVVSCCGARGPCRGSHQSEETSESVRGRSHVTDSPPPPLAALVSAAIEHVRGQPTATHIDFARV